MRVLLLLMVFFLTFGVSAEQCSIRFNESELITSVGKTPTAKKIVKENGVTKKQYEFRRELSSEEALSDSADEKYEPQFYLSIYNPSCSKRVKIWYFEDNKNTEALSNKTLAGRAFKYLTGVEESIFENKLKKFSNVQSFESFDDKTDSKFIKSGGVYSIDVYFR